MYISAFWLFAATYGQKMCISFHFVGLQERFLEKAKLSPDYFIADCEDMLVNFSISTFSLLGQIFYKEHCINQDEIIWVEID
jgi:hypothetical protein